MNREWSLDILYKGYDDPAFKEDMKKLEETVAKENELVKALSHEDEKAQCKAIIAVQEELALLSSKLMSYVSLRQSTNTMDSETVSYMNQINNIVSNVSKANAAINRYIADIEDLESVIGDDKDLNDYAYFLRQTKEDGKYLLQAEVEEVLSKMNLSGGDGWESMQSYLTSIVEVDYQGEKTTLSQIRNLAYDSNPAVRKSAYEAELAAYDKIKDAIAFSLNNIKAQVNTECDLRGFASPLDMTLYGSRMKRETLDALLASLEEHLPVFQKYLKRKGEILGHQNGLPWYDLFAPMGKDDRKYSLEEIKAYLLNHFRSFSKEMTDMIERAFDEAWIDFYPHKGKVGGAFCANLPFVHQSRVLANYDGSFSDIVTLAHELGHAFHGMMIEDHRILNTEYSMPVAETASTFNENIIMNAAIDEAQGEAKIALLESQLSDLTQIMCDIYSRFLFEKAVFEKRRDSFMFADELESIMLDAQKKAYGDGLDPDYLHPYMWICKSHYYSTGLSYYNWPYAFGGLFARGLVVKYKEMGDAFLPKYKELLHATTISSVEDVAKIADIDLTSKAFWDSCLKTCEDRVEEFLSLTENYHR